MSLAKPHLERNHPASSIRVVAIRPVNKGIVRAIADVSLGPSLVIREFKVIQQPGQRAWVSPPAREWQSDNGKRRFTPLIELAGSLKQRVEQAIRAAWGGGANHGS